MAGGNDVSGGAPKNAHGAKSAYVGHKGMHGKLSRGVSGRKIMLDRLSKMALSKGQRQIG